MSKGLDAKFASDIEHCQNAIRHANEDLIKLSQRFGRMMFRLQKLESASILSWFNLYNKIKDEANKSEEELSKIIESNQSNANPFLQTQASSFISQKERLFSKIEVMDDILSGIIEELLENSGFEDSQKQEMLEALNGSMAKSKNRFEPAKAQA